MHKYEANTKIFLLVVGIVVAELIAFALLQKSVMDETQNKMLYVFGGAALFGIVMPLFFRETLRLGSNMAVTNMYWVLMSQLGAIALGAVVFSQHLTGAQWCITALLLAAVLVAAWESSNYRST